MKNILHSKGSEVILDFKGIFFKKLFSKLSVASTLPSLENCRFSTQSPLCHQPRALRQLQHDGQEIELSQSLCRTLSSHKVRGLTFVYLCRMSTQMREIFSVCSGHQVLWSWTTQDQGQYKTRFSMCTVHWTEEGVKMENRNAPLLIWPSRTPKTNLKNKFRLKSLPTMGARLGCFTF